MMKFIWIQMFVIFLENLKHDILVTAAFGWNCFSLIASRENVVCILISVMLYINISIFYIKCVVFIWTNPIFPMTYSCKEDINIHFKTLFQIETW